MGYSVIQKVEDMIRIEDMKVGCAYWVRSRNFCKRIAIWDGKEFVGMREKFKFRFMDKEFHWDNGPPHGTCRPLALIG